METETILIKRSDGGVSVMTFVIKSPRDEQRNEATDDAIEAAIKKGRLDCVSWRRIERTALPGREYRDAWTDDGVAIGHDMEKARAICRKRLAAKRQPRDVDVTRIEAAQTVQDLAQIEASLSPRD